MTCIVGIADGSTVWLGGDSCAADTDQWAQHAIAAPKVRRVMLPMNIGREVIGLPTVIGFSASFRMADLLWQLLDNPDALRATGPGELPPVAEYYGRAIEADKITDILRHWLVGLFVPVLQLTYSRGGYQKVENERRSGGEILIGLQGRLFRIQPDYAVIEASRRYDAIGCGEKMAIGSLFSTAGLIERPKDRLATALMACAHNLPYVLPPFAFVSTAGDDLKP